MADTQHNEHNIGSRVSSLETSVNGLKDDLAGLAATVRDFATNTHNEIKELASAISTSGKTSWPTLISGAGLIIVLVAAIAGSYLLPLQTRINDDREINDLKLNVSDLKLIQQKEISDLKIGYEQTISHNKFSEIESEIERLRIEVNKGKDVVSNLEKTKN